MQNILYSLHGSWNGSRVLPLSESLLSFLLGTDASEQRSVCDTKGREYDEPKKEEVLVFISPV